MLIGLGILAMAPLRVAGGADSLVKQGDIVFRQRCVICHGEHADGDSHLGRLMNPHPANLLISKLTAAEREHIVRKGGLAAGRSGGMPAWETELSDEEITAVVAYVGSLNTPVNQASRSP